MKKSSTKVTKQLVLQAKGMLSSGQYHQHQIAAILGVNQGRISEIKNGFYD